MKDKENIIVLYLDPKQLTKEQIEEKVEEQKKQFKNRNCKITYHINKFGIYEITLNFTKKENQIIKLKKDIDEKLKEQQELQKQKNLQIKQKQQEKQKQRQILFEQKQELQRQKKVKIKQKKENKKIIQMKKEEKSNIRKQKQENYIQSCKLLFKNLFSFFSQNFKKIKEILEKDFKNFQTNCKIVFIKFKNIKITFPKKTVVNITNTQTIGEMERNVRLKRYNYTNINEESYKSNNAFNKQNDIDNIINNNTKGRKAMEKVEVSTLFVKDENTNKALEKAMSRTTNNAEFVEKIKLSQNDEKYTMANPFENTTKVKDTKNGHTKEKFKFSFEKLIDNSIEKQHQKDKERLEKNFENASGKLYGSYKSTKTYKPL